ncbi:MAG: DNA polymerase III subunit delta' [Burkholderiales bacterium]
MAMYPWTTGAWEQLLARRENLPQALLIHGPQGIGKLALARHFAQLILCETAGRREPCGQCDGCRWFLAGQHPDFRQIEPESMAAPVEPSEDAPAPSKTAKPSQEIKVDQVRALVDFLNIGSHRGKRRLALFHPAEDMNANAANSLLKSLEDPASGACFILISNNPRHLIPTIRSRCISLAVGIPEEAVALAWLKQESVQDGAQWLAFSGGAPLLAREYADSPRGEKIAQVVELLKKGGREALFAWPATDREHIEILSEVLQKWALDRAFSGFSGKTKYFGEVAGKSGADPAQWLKFAREAGRYRLASHHPLNPRLFATDLVSRIPG